jgi:hypothetical protein
MRGAKTSIIQKTVTAKPQFEKVPTLELAQLSGKYLGKDYAGFEMNAR